MTEIRGQSESRVRGQSVARIGVQPDWQGLEIVWVEVGSLQSVAGLNRQGVRVSLNSIIGQG